MSRLHAFYALLYLRLIPSSSSFGHQGPPFTREFHLHPPPDGLRRNVHVGVQFCVDSLVFSFLFSVTTNRKQKRWCSYRKVGASFLVIPSGEANRLCRDKHGLFKGTVQPQIKKSALVCTMFLWTDADGIELVSCQAWSAEMRPLLSRLFVCLFVGCVSVQRHRFDVWVAGEAVGTEEQTAVTITGVPQAAFTDHNVQYQFRTENSGGQVSTEKPPFLVFVARLCKSSVQERGSRVFLMEEKSRPGKFFKK